MLSDLVVQRLPFGFREGQETLRDLASAGFVLRILLSAGFLSQTGCLGLLCPLAHSLELLLPAPVGRGRSQPLKAAA